MRDELLPLLEQMSDVHLRLFACDCAEHVLPFFEHLMPHDQRPRLAIETARRFAKGETKPDALSAAGGEAEASAWAAGEAAAARCGEDTQPLPADDDAAASAAAAAEACCMADAKGAAQCAAGTAVETALIAALGSQRADLVWAWMWHFGRYAPEKLADEASLAAKVGQELLDQYRQAEKQERDWQMIRARVYLRHGLSKSASSNPRPLER